MKLYCISGLGADKRVFDLLKVNHKLIHLDWITPLKNENCIDYSTRLASSIDTTKPFGLIGVSFGGMIAVEIAKQLNSDITILISSTETKHGLRSIYRSLGKTKIINLMPEFCFKIPKPIAYYLFSAKNKSLLADILNDSDLKLTKWSVKQIINWTNTTKIKNCYKIGGNHDRMIPQNTDSNTKIINDTGHFMIVDKADEVSQIINSILENDKV